VKFFRFLLVVAGIALILLACTPALSSVAIGTPTTIPDWFGMALTDVQTGQTFTMHDFAGKVVLLETMAIWCPNCLIQAGAIQKLNITLGKPDDLILVSLDVDSHEDETALKEYASQYGLDWHLAVAPLLVERALGNLYSAEYLNPPLAPMLIIDRDGNVHQLQYGIKDVETLRKAVEPYLAK